MIVLKCLPTNDFLVKRYISVDPFYNRCSLAQELIHHLLRDCSKASQVWHALNFNFQNTQDQLDNSTWLHENATGGHGTLFAITCWWLWKSRNLYIFKDHDWTL